MKLRLGYVLEKIGVIDSDEWAVIGSKVQRVLEDLDQLSEGMAVDPLSRAAEVIPAASENPLRNDMRDIAILLSRPVLDEGRASDADLKVSLARLRDERKKLTDQLKKDRDTLYKVTTIRQETTLLRMGILE